mmetsp:Transcript_14085/g.35297  ORF Transcript_14085/g.35297 Transcript_14085/m.35297 type:complete len:201 (+) Transcript_14085:340-942(+)
MPNETSQTSQTDRNFYKTCSRTCPWERIPTSGCLNSREKMACSPFASRRLGRDTAKTDSGGTTSEDCVLKMSIQITKHFCKPSCKSSTEGQINNKVHSSQLLFFHGKIRRKGYALCSFLTKLRLCMCVCVFFFQTASPPQQLYCITPPHPPHKKAQQSYTSHCHRQASQACECQRAQCPRRGAQAHSPGPRRGSRAPAST